MSDRDEARRLLGLDDLDMEATLARALDLASLPRVRHRAFCLCLVQAGEHGICRQCDGHYEQCWCRTCYPRCEVVHDATIGRSQPCSG